MLDYLAIINKYYKIEDRSYKIFLIHAMLVTNKALNIARYLKLTDKQLIFIEESAMLHDIGVFKVKSEKMDCRGKLPYIAHGVAGGEILRAEGLIDHALVAERHVGIGLSKKEILARKLPLPPQDYKPITLEEKIITYADLFFSKREKTLWLEETPENISKELNQFGSEQVELFKQWQGKFER